MSDEFCINIYDEINTTSQAIQTTTFTNAI